MRHGFTLVEMLVVLVLVTLAAALAAPAFIPSPASESEAGPFAAVVAAARAAAVRRGEVVYLRVERSGAWRVDGDAAPEEGPLALGRLTRWRVERPLTLIISPLGSCAFDVHTATGLRFELDPLTCEVRAS